MKFTDVLKRYHISPLKYEDDRFLVERDYVDLFKILIKYFVIKSSYEDVKKLFDELNRKKEFVLKNTLLDLSEEELIDVLMGQNTNVVIDKCDSSNSNIG